MCNVNSCGIDCLVLVLLTEAFVTFRPFFDEVSDVELAVGEQNSSSPRYEHINKFSSPSCTSPSSVQMIRRKENQPHHLQNTLAHPTK